MTTIPELIKTISDDVQHAFEELTKLLLRKTLRPTLNPLGANTKVVYNPKTQKYERGYIGASPDDNINKYSYIMTNECLGWVADAITNFKVYAKFMKNNYPSRYPQGASNTHNAKLKKSEMAYSGRERLYAASQGKILPKTQYATPAYNQYKNFIEYLTARNMLSTISNRKAGFAYACDVPYTDSFKQLESIGRDIINQTDPSIPAQTSALLSTAMLRVKLDNLEDDLTGLSINKPEIYCSYIEMVKLINSVQRSSMVWVINLISTLTYQRWDDLTTSQQNIYIEALGESFIDCFNSNTLITILLQSGAPQLILKGSYFYSLLKMLFVVFGYAELTPDLCNVSMGCVSDAIAAEELSKHNDRYKGARYRRGESKSSRASKFGADTCSPCGAPCKLPCTPCNSCKPCNPCNPCKPCNPCPPSPCNPCNPVTSDPCGSCPIDTTCIINFITEFQSLYPTIVDILGGTTCLPDPCEKINCSTIPASYDCLTCIPEYLWRYNNFSYCKYLDYLGSKQVANVISAKINATNLYLQSL